MASASPEIVRTGLAQPDRKDWSGLATRIDGPVLRAAMVSRDRPLQRGRVSEAQGGNLPERFTPPYRLSWPVARSLSSRCWYVERSRRRAILTRA